MDLFFHGLHKIIKGANKNQSSLTKQNFFFSK